MKKRPINFALVIVLTAFAFPLSSARGISSSLFYGQDIAVPADGDITDYFGNGYGFQVIYELHWRQIDIGPGLAYRSYFDRGYYKNSIYGHVSRAANLELFNINLQIRGKIITEKSRLAIFWGVAPGIYFCDWKLSEASFGSYFKRLFKQTGSRKCPGIEFQLGFEIPIDSRISVRSTLGYSYINTNIRTHLLEYHESPPGEEFESESIVEYRSINLGGKLMGIGLVYRFGNQE